MRDANPETALLGINLRRDVIEMGKSVIDKLYGSLLDDQDYKDFPETEEARKKVKAYIMRTYLSDDDEEAHKQWMELER